jgi:outer membrane protein TolC
MIKKQLWLLLVAMLLSLSPPVTATTLTFNSLDEVIHYGVQHSPQLKAQRLQWESSKSLPKKLGSLSDPILGVRLNGTPAKNSDYTFDQKRYLLKQSFPFWGELTHLKELGDSKVTIAYLEFLLTQNKIVFSIESLVYKLLLNDELTDITKKNKAILTQLANIADVKYQAGLGLQANVLKAQVSKGKLDEELLSLNHQRIVLVEQLKKMLNVSPTIDITFAIKESTFLKDTLPTPNQNWAHKSLIVQKADAMKTSKQSAVQVEKDRYMPNFSAQVEYWDNSGMDNQYGGQIMMTVPWFNAKNSASLLEAKKQFESSQYSLQDSTNMVRSMLVSLVSDINTTHKKVLLYEQQLLKDAGLSLSNFRKSYEVDKASFIDYFEAEQTLYKLEKKHVVLKNRYYTQLSALKWQFEKGELPNE